MKSKTPLRIGVLGLTHDHVWSNLEQLKQVKEAVLVAAADPNQPLLDRVNKKYKCAVYDDYEAMLESETLDAVYVYSDNASGEGLTELAAEYGLHVMVEKPIAATLEGAGRMVAAVRTAGVRLMINWPFAWWPPLRHAIAMAEKGEIGQVWQVKYRAAHNGPREMGCSSYFYEWLYDAELNGGGAFADYCCYGALLARRILGMPSRVTGVSGRLCKEDIFVEDNGILVMSYPCAMAMAEASWSQIGKLSSYVTMIHGTTGTLMIEPGAAGKLLLATEKHPSGNEVKVPKGPSHLRHASAHFVHCLRTGDPFTPLGEDRLSRDAQEIVEAGMIAAERGKETSLPLKR